MADAKTTTKQDRYRAAHREKVLEYQRQYRASHREKARAYSKLYYHSHLGDAGSCGRQRARFLQLRYGITAKRYDEILELQGGVCAICGRPPSGSGRSGSVLNVDHDHETQAVRGLLCASCNLGIGKLGDDAEIIQRAANYVKRRQHEHTDAVSDSTDTGSQQGN